MKVFFLFIAVLLLSFQSQAQFWLGPKIGGQITSHSYQNKNFKKQYDVQNDFSWHAGLTLHYTTEQRFAVHSELLYQKVTNVVKNLSSDSTALEHTSEYTFLTTAMHGRMTFGGGAVQFMIFGGPRIAYWLGSSGSLNSQELFDTFGLLGPVEYDIKFGDEGGDSSTGIVNVPRPNRLQYGIDIGGGLLLDLATGQRLAVEARYTIGHSNMGFNNGYEIFDGIAYEPTIQFANDMIQFSVSYLFGYNPTDLKKGSSTNKLSNRSKKKK